MNDQQLHDKLPIGSNERIIAVVKHHWFAYAAVYIFAFVAVAVIIAASVLLSSGSNDTVGLPSNSSDMILVGGFILSILVVLFSFIPVYLLKQEALVLTEEALLQLKKPNILANKVSQVNLDHINDVTANQDALGSIFGYGHIKVETPGEQDDYSFSIIANPQKVAKQIIEAHENYAAALESGRIHSSLGARQPVPGSAWRPADDQTPAQTANPEQVPPATSNDQPPLA